MKIETIRELATFGREVRVGFGNYVAKTVGSGPTPLEGMVLSFLTEHPGANAKDVAAAFKINKSSVSEVLKNLEIVGFIKMGRSENDGRKKQIVVTEAGAAHKETVDRIRNAYDSALASRLTDEEEKVLLVIIEKLRGGIKEVLENDNE